MNGVPWRAGVVGASLALLLLAAASTSGAAPVQPSGGQITELHSHPGRVTFVFTGDHLAPGDQLDPKSVTVTSGGSSLPATASPTGSTSSAGPLAPRAVVLALDVSGSMAGSGIAAARAAAVVYANNLPADVKVGLLTFSDTAHLLLAPTVNRRALSAALHPVRAGGSTALYDGIVAAAAAVSALPGSPVRRMVILSDGADTASHGSLGDATSTLARSGIAADVVAFRLPGDQTVLNRIASASNGRVLPAASAGDLASAFVAAAGAFRQRVLVTVRVPASLAGKTLRLSASMNSGSHSLSATAQLTFPTAPPAIEKKRSTAPMGAEASRALTASPPGSTFWVTVTVAFLCLLVIALLAVWGPATSSTRAAKQSRLAELGRYRIHQTAGRIEAAPAVAGGETKFTERTLAAVEKAMRSRGKREGIVDELDRAALRMRPEEWIVLQVCAAVSFGAVVALLAQSVFGVVIGALLGWAACRMFIRRKTSRRAKAFEEQLPDVLQLVGGSLRTGFSLNQAFAGVVREGIEPSASEISRVLTEVRLGTELEEALDSAAGRMQCADLHWIVMAIRISREVGGNLSEVLQNTVVTMRERAQLKGQVRVLSAEGRMSAKVLIGLPFLLAGYLLAFKPDYLTPLVTTGIGFIMLLVGGALLTVGAFWLNRLVKIEV